MAVDANILIYERIREEAARGGSLKHAVQAGYQRAFWTIFDANLTTALTGIVLARIGTGPIKGFGLTLAIGIAASMFTALFVTQALWGLFVARGWIERIDFRSLLHRPGFDFVRHARKAVAVSLVFVAVGWGTFLLRGDAKYGIDFTGGTAIRMELAEPLGKAEVEGALERQLAASGVRESVEVQRIGEGQVVGARELGSAWLLRIRNGASGPNDRADFFEEQVRATFGDQIVAFPSVDQVGPAVAANLKSKALLAILVCAALICVYVWLRFDLWSGVAALVAAGHDVLALLGFLALLDFALEALGFASPVKFDLVTVSAFLTLVGYSINDTIVILDRIREDRQGKLAATPALINGAVNKTLSRTVLTSLTSLLVCLVLLAASLSGLTALLGFAVAMVFGVLVGTYSSVFIAAPLLRADKARVKRGLVAVAGSLLLSGAAISWLA